MTNPLIVQKRGQIIDHFSLLRKSMYQPIILLVNSAVTGGHSMPVPRSAFEGAAAIEARLALKVHVVERHVFSEQGFESDSEVRSQSSRGSTKRRPSMPRSLHTVGSHTRFGVASGFAR